MEFSELQPEILGNAALLSSEGRGMVLEDFALAAARALEEHGWLESRAEPNGDLSWWWSRRAETALDVNAVIESSDGREN
jgi:hypothetical protein